MNEPSMGAQPAPTAEHRPAAETVLLTCEHADETGLATELARRGLSTREVTVPSAPSGVRAALAGDVARHGTPRVLVNVLSRLDPRVPAEQVSDEAWRRNLDATLTRTLLAGQGFGRGMLAARDGVLVTVLAGADGDAVATTTDRAVVGLTRVLAVEWAPFGVRVAAVAPHGATRTGRAEAIARVIAYLAGPGASFVTGTVLSVGAP